MKTLNRAKRDARIVLIGALLLSALPLQVRMHCSETTRSGVHRFAESSMKTPAEDDQPAGVYVTVADAQAQNKD